ncbi:MAG: ribosomal L7Ae/L30e/S12e/Gadd45 family protein [Lachnospiraceae bacterium]|nr:ribosomal L7Ae/L30e/S12e/Gadd45 family protein [Lachnospiraceae bacterium]
MLDRIVVKKVIGIKQCTKLLKSGEGKVLYVAKDANAKLISPIIQLAKEKNIKIVEIPTMKELGKMSSIDVKSAAVLTLE